MIGEPDKFMSNVCMRACDEADTLIVKTYEIGGNLPHRILPRTFSLLDGMDPVMISVDIQTECPDKATCIKTTFPCTKNACAYEQ